MQNTSKTESVPSSPTLALIQQRIDSLPRGQRRIADYVLRFPSDTVNCTISELAQCTSSKSEASIVKFYRSLGFDSFKAFKLTIAQEIVSRNFYYSYEDITQQDSPSDIKRKIFNGAMMTLQTNANLQNDEAYEQATALLENAKRIVLLGYAASAAVCYYAHFRFLELGLNCHFSPDAHINTAILAKPNPGDLFFCVSMSGETPDITVPLKQARLDGVKVIALTGNAGSTITSLADVVICTSTDETAFIADVMNARIAQMCTVDALFSMLSIANEPESFSRLHLTRHAFHSLKQTKPKP